MRRGQSGINRATLSIFNIWNHGIPYKRDYINPAFSTIVRSLKTYRGDTSWQGERGSLKQCCFSFACIFMGTVGPMLCSGRASGSLFWMSWCSRSCGYKQDILSTFMSELWLNSWHAFTKLLLSRVKKLTRCWIFTFEISTRDEQCPNLSLPN